MISSDGTKVEIFLLISKYFGRNFTTAKKKKTANLTVGGIQKFFLVCINPILYSYVLILYYICGWNKVVTIIWFIIESHAPHGA